jgi:hypothetical protein
MQAPPPTISLPDYGRNPTPPQAESAARLPMDGPPAKLFASAKTIHYIA